MKTSKADGTQGIATVEVTYKEGKIRKLVLPGCFVKSDTNLLAFIDKKPETDWEKFGCTKYFFYTCDSELVEKSKTITTIEYEYHRFSNSKPDKAKSVELKYSSNQVFKVQNHIFLLCDSKELNKCDFFKKHCKKFKVLTAAERRDLKQIYGISCVEENKPRQLIPLNLKSGQSANDMFQLETSSEKFYKQIEDLGPVLLENGNTLVGSYEKTDNGGISISFFGNNQDNENKSDRESGGIEKNDEPDDQLTDKSPDKEDTQLDQEDNDKKMVEEKLPLKDTNHMHGAGTQENTVQGPDNKVMLPTSTCSDSEETSEESAYQSKEEIKSDKEEKPGQEQEQDETVTNIPSSEFLYSEKADSKIGLHASTSDEESQVKNQDEIDLGKGDVTRVSIEESAGTKENNPIEEIIASLPNGQKDDNLGEKVNIEKYRISFLHLAQNAAGNWQEVGRNLAIKDKKIRNLKVDHKDEGVKEQTYQMLVHWRQSDVKPTLEKLLTALNGAGLLEEAKTFPETSRQNSRSLDGGILVTEKLFNEIVKDVKDKWKFLGRYLALNESTIQSIKMDNPDHTLEQAQQMLVKWKQSKANHATTGVLMTALNDVGKSNVAKTVKAWELSRPKQFGY